MLYPKLLESLDGSSKLSARTLGNKWKVLYQEIRRFIGSFTARTPGDTHKARQYSAACMKKRCMMVQSFCKKERWMDRQKQVCVVQLLSKLRGRETATTARIWETCQASCFYMHYIGRVFDAGSS